jgi:hypothetical protein
MKFSLFILLITFCSAQAQSKFNNPTGARIKELQELYSNAIQNEKLENCSGFKFSPILSNVEECSSVSHPEFCMTFVALEIQISTNGKRSIVRSDKDGYIFSNRNCIIHTIDNLIMPSSISNFKSSLRKSDGSMDLQFTFKGNDIRVNIPLSISSKQINNAGMDRVIYKGNNSFSGSTNGTIIVRLRAVSGDPSKLYE